MTKKIISKSDISSALVCLKGESEKLGSLFSLSNFLQKHALGGYFRKAIHKLEIFSFSEQKWIYKGLITPELIDKVIAHMESEDLKFAENNNKRKVNQEKKLISDIIKSVNPKIDDVYITVNSVIGTEIPQSIISQKGIGVGNGIFLINIKHLIGVKI